MFKDWLINTAILSTMAVSFLAVVMVGYSLGLRAQEREMVGLCKETGMYLSKGYAISCKVLTNEGYYPKEK